MLQQIILKNPCAGRPGINLYLYLQPEKNTTV